MNAYLNDARIDSLNKSLLNTHIDRHRQKNKMTNSKR